MMKVRIFVFCLLFALILAVGGTSALQASVETSKENALVNPAAPNATAMVTVAHFAPFAADIVGTAVTITVNGGVVLTNTTFGAISSALPLPAGTYTVEIFAGSSTTPAITDTVMITDDTKYTLAAIGDGTNQSLELLTLIDDTTPLTDSAKLRIGHLAPFAASLGDTAVDICTDSNTVVVPNVPYKVVTDPYLTLPAGDYDLKIALAGTSCATVALDLPSVRLAAGDIVDVFAVGLNNASFPLEIKSTTGLTLTPATVNVAHFAPFAADMAGTSVSIRVDGSDVLTDTKFGDIATALSLDPGSHLIEVLPGGGPAVAISDTVVLTGGMDYTLAAIGDGTNQSLELLALIDDTTPLTDSAKLRIGHLAPFAASLGDTAVDICTDSNTVVVPNVPYKVVTDPYLTLPAGDYDLKIALAGTNCATVALDLPSVRLAAGDIVDVFAVGLNNAAFPLAIKSTTGLTLTPATVNVAHFAPFAADMAGTSVSIRVDGSDVLTDTKFGDIATALSLTPGSHLVEILPGGGPAVAISDTVVLTGGMDYTLAAIGDGTNQSLELLALIDDTTPLTDSAKLRIGHLAPFAASLGDTAVDICTDSNTVVVPNVPYKVVTDPYLTLPAGDYDLKIALAGTNCATVALDLPSVRLAAGDIVDVFAVGLNNSAFPLEIKSTTGLTLTGRAIYLPLIFQGAITR